MEEIQLSHYAINSFTASLTVALCLIACFYVEQKENIVLCHVRTVVYTGTVFYVLAIDGNIQPMINLITNTSINYTILYRIIFGIGIMFSLYQCLISKTNKIINLGTALIQIAIIVVSLYVSSIIGYILYTKGYPL